MDYCFITRPWSLDFGSLIGADLICVRDVCYPRKTDKGFCVSKRACVAVILSDFSMGTPSKICRLGSVAITNSL